MVKHEHSAARVRAAQLWPRIACTGLAAAAVVACASRAPQWFLAHEWSANPLRFGGYDFVARQSETLTGAGPNRWSSSDDSVRIDSDGVLHLTITEREGRWYSAEVSTPLPDAHCRVRFRLLTEPSAIDLAAIGAVFIYRNDQSELDVELGRWSKPGADNAQFVVAPPSSSERMMRFDLPSGSAPIDFVIDWGPDEVAFSARTQDGREHRFSYDGAARPEPGGHRLHLSMWLREPSPVSTSGLTLALRDLSIEPLQ